MSYPVYLHLRCPVCGDKYGNGFNPDIEGDMQEAIDQSEIDVMWHVLANHPGRNDPIDTFVDPDAIPPREQWIK